MSRYYDIVLTSKKNCTKVSYLADSFSVDDDRFLKIYSKRFGNVFVQIAPSEKLSINEFELSDLL